MKIVRPCETCGREVRTTTARIKNGRGKFCSLSCRSQKLRGHRFTATCHPDRPHFAKGQCQPCWRRAYEGHGNGREARLLRQIGLPRGTYDRMLDDQAGNCLICGKGNRPGGHMPLGVDHDHKTGKVRGLLCVKCNTMLGLAHDDPMILSAAARYLEEHT